jgi:hypothetical protein
MFSVFWKKIYISMTAWKKDGKTMQYPGKMRIWVTFILGRGSWKFNPVY